MTRRLLFILLLAIAPLAIAQHDTTGATAAHGAEEVAHEEAHGDTPTEEEHHGETYFGIPGWILKIANMALFIGVLVYFVGGPVKKAFRERGEQIRRASEEARERRTRADQMANEIQARLAAVEAEVAAIRQRAEAEGERQKKELIAAAEAESQKILAAARTEVENRLKHARAELTEYAGELAAERAESILKSQITEADQKKLFHDSLNEVGEVSA
jgi:F-type H+-transporting ATPase subunit b